LTVERDWACPAIWPLEYYYQHARVSKVRLLASQGTYLRVGLV